MEKLKSQRSIGVKTTNKMVKTTFNAEDFHKNSGDFNIFRFGMPATLAKMFSMKNKSIEPRGEEEIRNENEFLKMKLMLERGAVFGPCDNEALPAAVENEFLNYIAEFEKQADNPIQTTVFKKIGSPQHF